MSVRNPFLRRLWPVILQTVSWIFLGPGFVLVGKAAVEMVGFGRVTTNSLSWSSGGFLLLLIGSLMKSCRQECELHRSDAVDPND